ncbi:MAG: YHYH protein [Myxococcales bacterium]|nr:YHYH protein [Myxococcales bacterium]
MPLTPNGLQAKNYAFRIPRAPAAAAAPTDIPLLGNVAVTVTGIPIFGPTENPMDGYRDPVLDDRLRNLLDDCIGHTAPQGTYHFHARPECVIVSLGGENEVSCSRGRSTDTPSWRPSCAPTRPARPRSA